MVTEQDWCQYEIPVNFEIKDLCQYIKLMYESYIKSPLATIVSLQSEIVPKIYRENLAERRFRTYNSIDWQNNQFQQTEKHPVRSRSASALPDCGIN